MSASLLGLAFFPRTDAGQFSLNLKVPTGTRIEVTEEYVAKVEDLIRKIVSPNDFHMIVSTVGLDPASQRSTRPTQGPTPLPSKRR